jgi:two-component system OmpR family response regulator
MILVMAGAAGDAGDTTRTPRVAFLTNAVDDASRAVMDALSRDGIATTAFAVGAAVEQGLDQQPPDCLVLDMRNDPAAKDLMVWYTRHIGHAVIVVTGQADVGVRLQAISAGVADYLVAPFAAEEAVARIKVVLDRRRPGSPREFIFGDVIIDPDRHVAVVGGSAVPLSAREMAVLLMLIRNRSRIVSKKELLEEIWQEKQPTPNMVEATISSLRRKIDGRGAGLIHTVHRSGYVFQAPLAGPSSRAALLAERDRLLRERDEAIAQRDETIKRLHVQMDVAGEAARGAATRRRN